VRHAPPFTEILVVYDFDEDNTLPSVREVQREVPNLRLVKNSRGRGVLSALKTGLDTAAGEYVLITMADGSDDIADLPAMLDKARKGAVIVAASRYMAGGRQKGGPRLKRAMSRLAGLVLHHVGGMPIHDPTSNYKLYRRDFLRTVTIESEAGFELALELCAKAYRRRVPLAEVPTTWTDRRYGTSRFKMRAWLPHYLRWFLFGLTSRVVRSPN
jgi:glycosyltransferase involved in cell wall biosynthesis